MPCPINSFGQPACYIVPHPDRPNESFCASCNRRFYSSNLGCIGSIFWLLALVMAIALVFSITAQRPSQGSSPPSRLQMDELRGQVQ
jgi:hypothetical protein